jgi:hypothetical protein
VSNISRHRTRGVVALAAVAIPLAVAAPLRAQVGHALNSSPYHDLHVRYLFSVTAGRSYGSGGKVGVGPGSGTLIGARLDVHLGGATDLTGNLTYGTLDRIVLNPSNGPDTRTVGTFPKRLLIADVGITLVLTGEKTWNGLAPYVGASLGMAFGGAVPTDSSGFHFTSKFVVGPQVGVRLHLGQKFFLRFEARDVIWQLRYPANFFTAPTNEPTAAPILDPVTNKTTQWTHNPMLVASMGISLGH